MRAAEKKRTTKVNKKTRIHPGARVVLSVVVLLFVVVSFKSIGLHKKIVQNAERIAELQAELASEEARAIEIDAYEEYVGTDEYIEQIAKDRLGLAYPNETLFSPGD